jgi:hypothetical protein
MRVRLAPDRRSDDGSRVHRHIRSKKPAMRLIAIGILESPPIGVLVSMGVGRMRTYSRCTGSLMRLPNGARWSPHSRSGDCESCGSEQINPITRGTTSACAEKAPRETRAAQ